MKPVEWISNAVESFSQQHFSENMVGLHIRKTDKIDCINEGQFGGIEKHRQLLSEMEDELEKSVPSNLWSRCIDRHASVIKMPIVTGHPI